MPGDEPPILPRNRTCPQCDYDRTGLQDGRPCPECGFEIEAGTLVLPCWMSKSGNIGCIPQTVGFGILVVAAYLLYAGLRLVNIRVPIFVLLFGMVLLGPMAQRFAARALRVRARAPDYWVMFSTQGLKCQMPSGDRGEWLPWRQFSGFSIKRVRRGHHKLKFESEEPRQTLRWRLIALYFDANEEFANELEGGLLRLIK